MQFLKRYSRNHREQLQKLFETMKTKPELPIYFAAPNSIPDDDCGYWFCNIVRVDVNHVYADDSYRVYFSEDEINDDKEFIVDSDDFETDAEYQAAFEKKKTEMDEGESIVVVLD